MVPLSLSTSWNSNRHRDGEPMLTEIAELGFIAAELGHGIRYSLVPGLLKAVEGGVIRISSVHNFCPVPLGVSRPSPNCFLFSDPHPELRRAAVRHTLETLRFAERVHAPAVVLHLGHGGPDGITPRLERAYELGKIYGRAATRAKVAAVARRRREFDLIYGRVRQCLEALVPAAVERGIRLGFEIREDYAEFPDEIEMDRLLADFAPTVAGYWHDFGHAARKDFLGWHDHAATFSRRVAEGRLLGCHIHDCSPPDHDHRAVGDGEIDFAHLAPLIPQEAIRVLELSPRVGRDDVIKSKATWSSFAATSV